MAKDGRNGASGARAVAAAPAPTAGDLLSGPLDPAAATALLLAAGDVALMLDRDGAILDVTVPGKELAADRLDEWRGRRLGDLVTVEGRPKIAELVAEAAAGRPPRWRQVTHGLPSGEVPVRYACVAAGERLLAIGRDLRATAAVQQRLLQAQQSLERDYLRLRQAESRYRLMFDLVDEAVVIVDAASWRIAEANPAAHRLVGMAAGALPRQPVVVLVDPRERDTLIAHLGGAVAGASAPVSLTLRGGEAVTLGATPFRQDRATFLMVRMTAPRAAGGGVPDGGLGQVIERMPDAFVLTDRSLAIVAANGAFVDLAHVASADAVAGRQLGDWLGRPGVDMELVAAELRKSGSVRNVATIVRGEAGAQEEVELSAVRVEADGTEHLGFVIRGVARRLRDLPPAERDLPRSVEQLTELVGRVSLKEIVRESSDLIERLCIEAALAYTSDNRASAAEILGLSRQGLYSKLHRHGLGNLVDGQD